MVKKNEEKKYSLSNIEKNLVGNSTTRHNQELLDIFTYIAMERLGYAVTENTQFRTDADGILYVTEIPVEAETIEPKVA